MRAEDVSILREALPYLRAFTGKTFVIKLGGELVAHANLALLAQEIAFLAQLGLRLAVVHGGGPQADDLSRRLGQEPVRVAGRRITDADTLEVAKMAFRGQVNSDLLAALQRQGVAGVGLSGMDGGVLTLCRRPAQERADPATGARAALDYGFVGDVVAVDPTLLLRLIEHRYVPVLCSLGSDPAGVILNVNADTVAAELAVALGASKLLILSTVPGVLRDRARPESRYSVLSPDEAEALLSGDTVDGGMRPKLSAGIAAVRRGVERAHILSGTVRDAILLELFSHEGCGTLITRPPGSAD